MSLIIGSLAPSSRVTYRRAINLFLETHRNAPNVSPNRLPASVPAIIAFISHLHSLNYAPATITSYCSAISFINKLHNSPDPMKHFLVSKMLEGARKTNQKTDTRRPITLAILHKLTTAIHIIHHDTFHTTLLKAMFLLAFHAFLRVGEITVRSPNSLDPNTIRAEDCSVGFTGKQLSSVHITIRNSKHNQQKPFHITIPASNTPNCPALAIHNYLKQACPSTGALFQNQSGSPITRHFFQTQLKRCIKAAKINNNQHQYKSHSFRIGAATEAVSSLGLSDQEIQRLGRWRSDAFRAYIRTPSFTSINR